MTFYAGNQKKLYAGTQSGKGTAQNTPTIVFRLEEFTPDEVRAKQQTAETDGLTQDGADVVTAIQPGFTFKCYARPSEVAFLYQALLGGVSNSGSGPNYTHTETPTLATPYLTFFEVDPSLLCNKYVDGRVTRIEATGEAGGFIELTVNVAACSFEAGASPPSSPAFADELPYTYPEVKVTKGGVYDGSRDAWSLVIDRQGKRALGDAGLASLDYVNGKFAVTGSLTQFAQADDDQRQVDTGSTSGTDPTTDIYSEALKIELIRDSNTQIKFEMAEVSYPTRAAAVNPDGSPLLEVLGFRTLPQSTLAGNITVTVKDQRATPDG